MRSRYEIPSTEFQGPLTVLFATELASTAHACTFVLLFDG